MGTGLIVGGVVLVIVVLLLAVYIAKYKTVGPDEALIVTGNLLGKGPNIVDSGDGKKVKIIRGGGTFVVPVFQQAEPLNLRNHQLDVSAIDVFSQQGVPVSVNAVSIIKIGSSLNEVSTAAEQYLGKSDEEIRREAKSVLEGHLRAILSSMTVEDIFSNRNEFAQQVQSVAKTDLAKMGLIIVSFTIKDVNDKEGYLVALGEPQIAMVKRDAQIAKVDREKEARVKNAEAEKEAKQAEFLRDTQIAEAEKEKELKVAEYRRQQDIAKAEADQAYELQEAKAKQQVIKEKMEIEIIERQKQIELEEKEITRREKQYDAEVKKKADADRYAIEQAAEAERTKQFKSAEAERFNIEQKGLAEASIEKAKGEAEAAAELAKGNAEADIILAKGLAEAQAKEKIAEAFKLYEQAAVMDMYIKMLPEFAKQVAAPLGNIDKITVVDTGGGNAEGGGGANRVTSYATNLMTGLQETLKETTGLNLKEVIETYSGKHNTNNSLKDLTEVIAAKKVTEAKEGKTKKQAPSIKESETKKETE